MSNRALYGFAQQARKSQIAITKGHSTLGTVGRGVQDTHTGTWSCGNCVPRLPTKAVAAGNTERTHGRTYTRRARRPTKTRGGTGRGGHRVIGLSDSAHKICDQGVVIKRGRGTPRALATPTYQFKFKPVNEASCSQRQKNTPSAQTPPRVNLHVQRKRLIPWRGLGDAPLSRPTMWRAIRLEVLTSETKSWLRTSTTGVRKLTLSTTVSAG